MEGKIIANLGVTTDFRKSKTPGPASVTYCKIAPTVV